MQMIKLSESTAALRRIFFTMVDATDLHTRETGVTVTVTVSKNGAAGGASAGTVAEVDSTNNPGLYYYEATAGEVDTVGSLCLYCTGTGCEPRDVAVQITSFSPFDLATEIVDAILAAIVDGARTVKGVLTRVEAFTSGKWTGLLGATAEGYAADGTTVVISAAQDTTAGTRDAATVAGD